MYRQLGAHTAVDQLNLLFEARLHALVLATCPLMLLAVVVAAARMVVVGADHQLGGGERCRGDDALLFAFAAAACLLVVTRFQQVVDFWKDSRRVVFVIFMVFKSYA